MKTLIIFFLIFISNIGYAKSSMRSCMLLPVKDSVGGAIAFRVFEEVERYLKESEWCTYTSNSEILNIFANYKKNIESILENDKVLRIVSEKTRTGSLIKIKIINQIKGVDVDIKVLGENGKDIYFKENTRLNSDEYTVIAQTIKNWLDIYEKKIPYDGRVLGVLGNQFTADAGFMSGVRSEDEVYIVRPLRKRKHPLLKEIVDWETLKIGTGKIIHSNKNQSQGKVLQYDTKKKLLVEDWLILKKANKENYIKQPKFDDTSSYEFGKLGTIGLNFNVGSASATSTSSSSTKKLGGTLLGVDLDATLWATRNYWGSLSIAKKVASLSNEEGDLTNESNNLSLSKFDLQVGYKYLPMGFFYGPQIDGYIGYASYSFGLDTSTADGFTEVGFKGFKLGAIGSVPFRNVFRIELELSFLVSPGFSEDVEIYGESDSASSYSINFGGSYLYSPNMTIDASYGITSAKAKFQSATQILKLKESALRLGTTFTF